MTQRSIETPWGSSQHHSDYAVGIVFHSTASHGGFQLSLERQVELHEVEAFRAFGPGWLEEDCDAALVALRWPGFATDEAIADAILTARQVASWEHSAEKWQPVVEWLETTSLQERADRHNDSLWSDESNQIRQ